MKGKTINTFYWTLTIVFAFMLFLDGIGGITRQPAGQEVLRHLGYPMYLLTISGVAKVLAAMAIVQPFFPTLKEWAYAGVAINFIGAFASRLAMGDSAGETYFPIA